MEWAPAPSGGGGRGSPRRRLSVTGAPRLVTPSWNWTVPDGVPDPVTVAVNETDWPIADGFGPAERTSAVAVGASDTFVPPRISTAA